MLKERRREYFDFAFSIINSVFVILGLLIIVIILTLYFGTNLMSGITIDFFLIIIGFVSILTLLFILLELIGTWRYWEFDNEGVSNGGLFVKRKKYLYTDIEKVEIGLGLSARIKTRSLKFYIKKTELIIPLNKLKRSDAIWIMDRIRESSSKYKTLVDQRNFSEEQINKVLEIKEQIKNERVYQRLCNICETLGYRVEFKEGKMLYGLQTDLYLEIYIYDKSGLVVESSKESLYCIDRSFYIQDKDGKTTFVEKSYVEFLDDIQAMINRLKSGTFVIKQSQKSPLANQLSIGKMNYKVISQTKSKKQYYIEIKSDKTDDINKFLHYGEIVDVNGVQVEVVKVG